MAEGAEAGPIVLEVFDEANLKAIASSRVRRMLEVDAANRAPQANIFPAVRDDVQVGDRQFEETARQSLKPGVQWLMLELIRLNLLKDSHVIKTLSKRDLTSAEIHARLSRPPKLTDRALDFARRRFVNPDQLYRYRLDLARRHNLGITHTDQDVLAYHEILTKVVLEEQKRITSGLDFTSAGINWSGSPKKYLYPNQVREKLLQHNFAYENVLPQSVVPFGEDFRMYLGLESDPTFRQMKKMIKELIKKPKK